MLPRPTIEYQPYDPLEGERKRIEMRNAMLAGQGQELENESRQNDLAEYQAYHDAIQNAGGDIRSALPEIIKAAPNRGMALAKAVNDWDTADLNKKKELLDIHAKKVAGLAQLAGGVTDEQSKQYAIDQAQKNGLLDPAEAEHLRQTPYSPDLVKGWQQAALSAQDQIQNQQKALEFQETQRHNRADEAKGAVDQQEMNDWLSKNPGKGPSDFMAYKAKLVPAFKFNLDNSAGNGALNPRQQATVKAILEGRMSPPSSFALKTPYWSSLMGEVLKQDPQFSEQRAQLRKNFTVGKQSTEINAINTAMGHVGVMGDAIDALDNGNLRVLNQIANRYGLETGSTPQAVFKTIVHRVGPELAKAYIGAGGSAGERGSDEKDFDPNLAPQTLKANVGITAKLLRSKIGALQNQWDQNRGPGMESFEDRFIMPEAKAQLDKWAPQSAGPSKVPPGATHKAKGSDGLWHYTNSKGQDLGVAQ